MVQKKKLKGRKEVGITLVALVVTVVVLLILAGITIMYVMGDNSVFNQASQAKIQTELGKIEEQAGLIYADKFLENKGGSVTNKEIVDKLIEKGNNIEIRNVGATAVNGISLEPATVSMDQGQTETIKVKIDGPEDGNFYYAVIEGKYYKINFQGSQLTIEREATTPEGNAVETANIEIETGYDATIVTNAQISQSEKTITVTSGTKYGNTELTVKYGDKTAKCTVKVEEVESNWAEIAEMAKAIANDSSITNSSSQATVTVNGASKTIKVGDILKVKYDGAIRRVRVLGFKHDDLVNPTVAYGSGTTATKAGISFEFYDFMTGDAYMSMNASNDNTGGWAATQMRKDLNGYTTNNDAQSGAIGGLGAKLSNQGYIKQVKKSYIKEYGNANSIYQDNDSSKGKHYTQDYLWLLACSEVVNAGYQAGAYGYAITTEGSQYKYYQGVTEAWNTSSTGRTKYNASGAAYSWWLRSPNCYGYAGYFCIVNNDRQ